MALEDYTNLDDDKFKSWVSSLDDTTRATLTGKTAFDQYRASLQSTGTLVERLKRPFQTLKSFFEIQKKGSTVTMNKELTDGAKEFFEQNIIDGEYSTESGSFFEALSLLLGILFTKISRTRTVTNNNVDNAYISGLIPFLTSV